ncbi:MAG: lipid A deacylase LpxR family protein [Rhodospirillales bacterium]|nr:lipid A deacylase LpxR family protein [Rhodospirillales bacterium]
MIRYIALIVLFAGVILPGAAFADDRKDFGTWSFQLENDLFAGTDQHYTNGLRLSWLSPDGDTVEWLALARDALEAVALDDDDRTRGNKQAHFGASLGQDIYTPTDRYRTDVIANDRPYAGWLYGAVALHTITDHGKIDATRAGLKDLESVELQIGVVGPWALGEQAQNLIHEVRLIDTFNGWDNQLNNEPGVVLLYDRKWRLASPTAIFGGLDLDAIPGAGVSLGNVMTEARAGGTVRLGWNLPENFGPPSLIQGGVPFHELDDAANGSGLGVYLFAAAEGRYVAHNMFLDGNTFEGSHSVNKHNWVGDLSLGLSVLAGPVNVTYASAFRTREYDGQDRLSRFGSLTFTWQAVF